MLTDKEPREDICKEKRASLAVNNRKENTLYGDHASLKRASLAVKYRKENTLWGPCQSKKS